MRNSRFSSLFTIGGVFFFIASLIVAALALINHIQKSLTEIFEEFSLVDGDFGPSDIAEPDEFK